VGDQVEQCDELAYLEIPNFSGQAGTRIDVAVGEHVVSKPVRLEVHLIVKLVYVHVTS
jgi:hypothetical protein